jgi:Flp pilus assembly protein TadG
MSGRTQSTSCERTEAPASSPEEDRAATPWGARGRKRSIVARIRALAGSDTRGSALVEMAVALPPVLLVITGVAAFSIALAQKLELAEAVNNGGRVLAVARQKNDPCTLAYQAVDAAAPTLNPSSISLTITLNGVQTGPSASPSCPGTGGGANLNLVQGGNATILATYTCSIHAYGFTYPGCNLATSLTEVVQ